MRRIICRLLVVGLLFSLALTAHAGDTIKVGVIDCYSGPASVYGTDALNGFKLALEEINPKGVLGRKIEFTTRDTKFKVDIALNMAKELVLRSQVDLLVGTINSAAAMAVSEAVAKREKVPFITWISKSERITGEKGHRYVFSCGDNTAMSGKAGATALAKRPYKKYWIAGDDYEYGHAIAKAAWRNLKAMKPGVEKIGESWWKPGEPDFVPYLTAILAAKPDAVIFATGGLSMTNIMKTIKSIGMQDQVPIWIHSATDHAVLKPLGAQAPEGVMGTIDYHFYYPPTPENQDFARRFEKKYGTPPGFPALHGYITAKFIAKAYATAGAVKTEKFVDALAGSTIDSPVGPLTMRDCDHQVALPMYFGVTRKASDKDYFVATDIVTLSGDQVLPTCEEIAQARK